MANDFLASGSALGEIVDGAYRLGAAIHRSGESALFETEFGEDSRPAVIRICEGASESSELLKAHWSNALELTHPNLLRVYATGSSVLHGTPIIYLVTERADECLNNVLQERALTAGEVREMLAAVLAGLKYLHQNGYAHSRLVPSNVLAVGDRLKLSSDCVIRSSGAESAAEDMRALGVLIVQALTRITPDPYVPNEVPQPFREIVRHCMDPDPRTRWTADQVEAKLNAPEERPLPPAPQPEAINSRQQIPSQPGLPRWIYGAVAALVVMLISVSMVRRGNRTAADIPATDRAVTSSGKSVITPQAEPRNPEKDTAAPAVGSPALAQPKPIQTKKQGWAVIVATYNSREAAEKRMRSIAQRWPGFHVTVSQPPSDKTHYLVTLGQNLGEDQAEAVRKRAVESGLPRDTYIKRVM